ncbi:unnamed protein product [Closterium sp. NIES-54]
MGSLLRQSYDLAVQAGLRTMEANVIPDRALRPACRYLMSQRIAMSRKETVEEQLQDLVEFAESLKSMPIALSTAAANEQHYEVPTELFQLCLGKRLKYSCCYFPTAKTTLDEAEELMLAMYCERAQLVDGQDVLELGCGWGSLSLYMGEKYPTSRIVGVSNSSTQRAYIEGQCKKRGINNVRIITADMNTFQAEGTFDRVISVEMFEHMKNYQLLLKKVASWMKPEALLFIHIFTHKDFAYHFEDAGPDDWMTRYFFTGGTMPADKLLLYFQDDLSIANHWCLNGTHYQRTSEAWLRNFDANIVKLRPILAETYGKEAATKWTVYWRTFFIAVAELFGYSKGQEWVHASTASCCRTQRLAVIVVLHSQPCSARAARASILWGLFGVLAFPKGPTLVHRSLTAHYLLSIMPAAEADPLGSTRNGLSVLGVLPRLLDNYTVPITLPQRDASPDCEVRTVYQFEPPDSPSAWEPHPSLVLVPGGGEGSSKATAGTPSIASTTPLKRPRVGAMFTQQTLWGAPASGKATSPPRPAAHAEPKPPTASAKAEFDVAKSTFDTQWAGKISWLRLIRMANGRPSLKCAACIKHGDPGARTAFGIRGEGGRDLQVGSIRSHSASQAHKQALKNEALAEAAKAKQATLTRWQTTDASTKHIIRCLHIALFVCKADAPIAMFVPLCWFLAKEGLPDLPPVGGYGAYYTEEALAARDAADAVPELRMVDDVVRAFAKHIGRSSVHYQKFQNLQHNFCQTNLEAQGIYAVRWLSRGEAVNRLLEVLPAAVVVLKEYKAELYEVVTSFKFQWLIRFLADVLWELNHLNQRFQQRQSLEKREMKAEGVDADGTPISFVYTMHERPLPHHETDGDVTACVELSMKFVKAVDTELEWRMRDLHLL